MKKPASKILAKCIMPVQIFDDGLTGYYWPEMEVDGEKAQLLLERYPNAFTQVVVQAKENSNG